MPIDLQHELTALRKAVLTMGASVEQRVAQVVDALIAKDVAAAAAVRTGDKEIDRMESENERECLKILALSHPVARDLRFVLAAMRINTDLERIADMAKGIAKRVLDLNDLAPIDLPSAIVDMGISAKEMVAGAVEALAEQDVELARRIRRSDDRVDDLQKEIFIWVQEELPKHIDAAKALIDILSIARKLERIADVATNIAEDVIFLCEGRIVRHTPV